MKAFDELRAMTDAERLDYLHEEAEKLIAATAPNNQLRMRALQAKCDAIRRKYKHPPLACAKIVELMQERFIDLNNHWQSLI